MADYGYLQHLADKLDYSLGIDLDDDAAAIKTALIWIDAIEKVETEDVPQ